MSSIPVNNSTAVFNKIMNLGDATLDKDALNRITADNRYYRNITKLNEI